MSLLRTIAVMLATVLVAMAIALVSMIASSQPEPFEADELLLVGNITMTQHEGEVVSIDDSSITLITESGDVRLDCTTHTALWEKDKVQVGDRVWVSYHVDDNGERSLNDIRVLTAS